ncbi:MAG: hypothetical protein KBB70_01705 [Candidatus Pacebacteria bacterium]|nr:hypothetical protein [Candidatus Paceibacterota bacterium]
MNKIENARKYAFTAPFVIIGFLLIVTAAPWSNEWLAGLFAIGWGLFRHHPETDQVISMKNSK